MNLDKKNNLQDLTLIVCSYNTPEILITALKSFVYHHTPFNGRLLLMENSSNNDTQNILDKHSIPYVNTPNSSHAEGVNTAIKLCKTDYALLIDSDVFFIKNIESIFQQFKDKQLTIAGKVTGDRGNKKIYNRIDPWFCFLNIKHMKDNGLEFCNIQKTKESFKQDKIYDIGSTLFEDIRNKQLKIGNVNLENNYFIHLEGMSWYKNKYDPTKPDTGIDFGGTHNNPAFIDVFNNKINRFNNIASIYNKISLKNVFKKSL